MSPAEPGVGPTHDPRDAFSRPFPGWLNGVFVLAALIGRLSLLVQRKRWGLLKRVHLPPALEVAAAVVLLDYTLYVWHVLTHRAPLLWRFHRVHHADLDLTASTALRFHFGEITISVLFRAGQVLFIGVSPKALNVWQ